MTSPVSVGQVSVELVAEARELAKSVRKEVEGAFKGLNLGKLIRSSVGNTKISIPVEPDVDTDSIPAKVRKTSAPKVPVEIDPLLTQFQQQVRRQLASLARQVNANVPVNADTAGFRAELGAQLKAIQAQSRLQIPTEPGAKAEYEAKLRAELAAVAARVKQTVRVDVDVDKGGSAALSGIGNLIKGFGKGLPNIGGLATRISDLGGALQRAAGSSAQLGGSLTGAVTTATGPIGIVIGLLVTAAAAMAGLAAAAVAAVPAITAVAGAAAAIPAALTGIGAAVGVLALGFKGIGDAFKPKTGGGGGSSLANQARQVAAASRQVEAARRGIGAANRTLAGAERNLTIAELEVAKAQDRARLAQEAVSRARREAAEDIADLNRALRGAQLSEQEAALAVRDALRELEAVRLTGNIPDIQRAELAYQRALLTLEEATDTTGDLQQQTDEANRKGVEGSDKVQQALREQTDTLDGVRRAQEGVLDAQNAVLSAQDGLKSATDGLASAQDSLAQAQEKVAAGGAGAAAQMVKLAPAGQRFVNAIKALKPAFESLRLDVQQRLFQGLDKTVTRIGEAWIPALRVTLGRYADTLNEFFRNLGATISTPKFISDMQAGAEGFRQLLDTVGESITGKLLPAFGALSRAAGPFLSALGDELAEVVTQFSDWVLAGEKSGGLQRFFEKASQAMRDIFDIGGTVASIIGSIFEIITGAQPSAGEKNPLQTFREGLQKVAEYLNNPANQQKIRDFLTRVQEALDKALYLANRISELYERIRRAFGGDQGTSLGVDIGAGIITGILAGMVLQGQVVIGFLQGLFHMAIQHVKNMLGIKSPSTVFASIGSDIIRGLMGGIGSSFGGLLSTMARVPRVVIGAVAGAGSWLVSAGKNAIIGLGNGIVSLFGTLGSWAGIARVYVQNALVGAGSWLYQHGRAVISGLMQGISSMFNTLGNFLGQVGSFIQAHKGPIDKDRRLLVGAGRAIMTGLITGIADEKRALAAELADVTSIVAGVSMPSLGVDSDTLSRSVAVADQRSLLLGWKTGTTGDQILDAIAGHIDLRFNGNVQAAFSRT